MTTCNVEDIMCDSAVFSLGYELRDRIQALNCNSIVLAAFITVNTNAKTSIPQVSGLSSETCMI